MGAQLRVYRQKIKATQSMKKLFTAMELIATSRISKARARVNAASPYSKAITKAVSAVAAHSDIDHTLTTEPAEIKRAAILLMTADRGMAGAYSASVIKRAESLRELLKHQGKEVDLYLVGRKGQSYYQFRHIEPVQVWTGNTDAPQFEMARELGETLLEAFTSEHDGVDEIHVVYTEFKSMVLQEPTVVRLLPLRIVAGEEGSEVSVGGGEDAAPAQPAAMMPLYDFEPSAEEVLDTLLPRYIDARLFNCLLQSAASELASRQRAMKAASDNAGELIKKYTRLANTARQAEITQELSEIVAGADALSGS